MFTYPSVEYDFSFRSNDYSAFVLIFHCKVSLYMYEKGMSKVAVNMLTPIAPTYDKSWAESNGGIERFKQNIK